MGWTSSTEWETKKDLTEYLRRQWDRVESPTRRVIRQCVKGRVLYQVVEMEQGHRFIAVNLLEKDGTGWAYKDLTEDDGPNDATCPVKYIDLADEAIPPEGLSNYAKEFRERCRLHHTDRIVPKYERGTILLSPRPLSYGGVMVSRFVVSRVPRGRRSVYCKDADGRHGGLLRLHPWNIDCIESQRDKAIEATKAKV